VEGAPVVIAVGLVLLVLCSLLAAGIALSNTEAVSASAFGVSLSDVSLGGLFLVGVAVGALAMLGLALVVGGAARRRSKRRAARREVHDARGEADYLAEENARLHSALEQQRQADVYPTETPTGAREADVSSSPGRHRR
jgi:uncharacterized integral membrane protein